MSLRNKNKYSSITFNHKIKPGPVKLVLPKARIVLVSLPLAPIETPESGRHGEQEIEQNRISTGSNRQSRTVMIPIPRATMIQRFHFL
jgi:hypothetical protein